MPGSVHRVSTRALRRVQEKAGATARRYRGRLRPLAGAPGWGRGPPGWGRRLRGPARRASAKGDTAQIPCVIEGLNQDNTRRTKGFGSCRNKRRTSEAREQSRTTVGPWNEFRVPRTAGAAGQPPRRRTAEGSGEGSSSGHFADVPWQGFPLKHPTLHLTSRPNHTFSKMLLQPPPPGPGAPIAAQRLCPILSHAGSCRHPRGNRTAGETPRGAVTPHLPITLRQLCKCSLTDGH